MSRPRDPEQLKHLSLINPRSNRPRRPLRRRTLETLHLLGVLDPQPVQIRTGLPGRGEKRLLGLGQLPAHRLDALEVLVEDLPAERAEVGQLLADLFLGEAHPLSAARQIVKAHGSRTS